MTAEVEETGRPLPEMVREYLVLGLSAARRRWLLLVLPVTIAIPLAVAAVYLAPMKYSAKSLVMLQSANRAAGLANSGNYQRQSIVEQVAAIEAWLKSDSVLSAIVRQVVDPAEVATAEGLNRQLRIMRTKLSLELIGGSALEIRLDDNNPKGLGHRLEVILARLMEGLTGPEQSILNASQFVTTRRAEAVAAAETALLSAVATAPVKSPEATFASLKKIHELRQALQRASDPAAKYMPSVDPAKAAATIEILRQEMSGDAAVVSELETLYGRLQDARTQLESNKDRSLGGSNNYVGIFDAPDHILLVGRPQDPLTGESSVRKLAIAGVLFSIILGAALVVIAEFFSTRLRTRAEFEAQSDLPVIARLPKTA